MNRATQLRCEKTHARRELRNPRTDRDVAADKATDAVWQAIAASIERQYAYGQEHKRMRKGRAA